MLSAELHRIGHRLPVHDTDRRNTIAIRTMNAGKLQTVSLLFASHTVNVHASIYVRGTNAHSRAQLWFYARVRSPLENYTIPCARSIHCHYSQRMVRMARAFRVGCLPHSPSRRRVAPPQSVHRHAKSIKMRSHERIHTSILISQMRTLTRAQLKSETQRSRTRTIIGLTV